VNQLEIIIRSKVVVQDRRYRILVTLVRSDRPVCWNFLCNNCGTKVQELLNYDAVDMADFYDPQNVGNAAVGRHCKGSTGDGLPCPFSYYFRLQ
jgi:hypothetical protein